MFLWGSRVCFAAVWVGSLIQLGWMMPHSSTAATCGNRNSSRCSVRLHWGKVYIYSHLHIFLSLYYKSVSMCFSQCSSCFHSETKFFLFWKKRFSEIALKKKKKGCFSLKEISYKSFKEGLNFAQIHLLPLYDACYLCKHPWKWGLDQSCSVLPPARSVQRVGSL